MRDHQGLAREGGRQVRHRWRRGCHGGTSLWGKIGGRSGAKQEGNAATQAQFSRPRRCLDLAAAEPDRLATMIESWWQLAERGLRQAACQDSGSNPSKEQLAGLPVFEA